MHPCRYAAAAVLFAAGWVLPADAQERSAEFDSDFGPLTLTLDGDRMTGHYPEFQGRLRGSLSENGSYEMSWFQPQSEVRCNRERRNTFYWGRVVWQVEANGDLSGQWSYCNRPAGSGGAWNAALRAGSLQAAPPSGAKTSKPGAAAGGLEDGDFYSVQRFEWGQNAHLNEIQLLSADVTCDGSDDRIGGWIDQDSPEGTFYRVMVVTSVDGGAPEGFTASFPIEDGEHDSFCRRGALPMVSLEPETHDRSVIVDLFGFDTACSTVIRLDDGLCDSWRLGWLTEPFQGERLVLHRN